METEGRRLHAEAAKAREAGEFQKSLAENDRALEEYDKANDSAGYAEGVSCRAITLGQFESRRFNILAKYEMMAAVEIARESGDATAVVLPLFNLAKRQESLDELPEAVKSYKQAVDAMTTTPPESHNRPSVLADMKVHLSVCEYKSGDESALERAKESLHELENADEPSKYSKDVWVSGGYMHLAEALLEKNPEEAKQYLSHAKKIIDANDKLLVRKAKWEKLAARFDNV